MKSMFLTVALALSSTAIAQTPPATDPASPNTQSTMPSDSAMPADTVDTTSATASPTPAPDSTQPMPADPAATMGTTGAGTPMPATGAKIVQPSQSVEQAFPPPAAKAEYPWCSRTVTDGCKQRNDPGNRA